METKNYSNMDFKDLQQMSQDIKLVPIFKGERLRFKPGISSGEAVTLKLKIIKQNMEVEKLYELYMKLAKVKGATKQVKNKCRRERNYCAAILMGNDSTLAKIKEAGSID